MEQDRVVIVSGARTPFVRARTVFKKMSPANLGGIALRETVAKVDMDPALIDECYFGIVSPPAEGTNVAREAVFDSGLPSTIAATTVNRYCASSGETAASIMAKIQNGQIDVGLAGGVESISSIRALFSQDATDFFQDMMRMKTMGQKLGMLAKFKASFLAPNAPGLKEPTTGLSMGQSADRMSRDFKVSREEQDQFAVESHHKAAKAWENGFYQTHVASVGTPDGKVINKDTDIRADTTLEQLAKLRPVFYKDGTITAGNASPMTDGASSVLMMKESKARELGIQPLGTIRGVGVAGVDIQKEHLLIGPAYAIPKALKNAGISWSDLDLLEIHEAFAGQVLSTIRAIESKDFARDRLGLSQAIGQVDRSILNVNGGSIPLGHPFGATGTRVILQAIHELRRRKKNLGLVSICAAGGLGFVAVVEAV